MRFCPEAGGVISQSVILERDTFRLEGNDSVKVPVLTIAGNNLTVDFNGAVLTGADNEKRPDRFSGLGILIKGKNITLKNATVRGYKVAVMAIQADSLRLVDCDFSYNYRQRLKSTREREDMSDWLSYHHNDDDEWLRYGAAVYLKKCNGALVKNIKITGGQNGLMLTGCNGGVFYNNNIQFNSGVGIGLYRSSYNKIMHNRLDWNVRGYSHGIYQRGQDSAGILVYEQSSGNVFAYNSATHSGDGFFLWAGQTTMDTGRGGCNDNLVFKNDFSFSPTNGVEITFSSNDIICNKMEECKYGIWGGYSYDTKIEGNYIENCRYGIATEHGNNFDISFNFFKNTNTGIKIWERESQPADWGFARNRNVESRNFSITDNHFSGVKKVFDIENTDSLAIANNLFFNSGYDAPRTGLVVFSKNKKIKKESALPAQEAIVCGQYKNETVPPLADGLRAELPADQLKGRQYILVDEWGPYDFRSPSIWLRGINGNKYTFLLLGPPQGNYKITDGKGWTGLNRVSGAFPATLIATKKEGAEWLVLNLEYIGEGFTDRWGRFNKKGKIYPFAFKRLEKKIKWKVRFYNYDENTDPVNQPEAFKKLIHTNPVKTEIKEELYFTWWESPGAGLQADRFATVSQADFEIKKGRYKMRLTSDDGARLWLDDQLLIDHWDIHEPATDEIEVELGGRHHLEIRHFEAGGFGTLAWRLDKL